MLGGGGVQQYLCVPNAIDVQQALQNGLAMSAKAGGIVVHPDDCHVQAAQMLCQPDSLQGMVLVFLHMQCFNTWASELPDAGGGFRDTGSESCRISLMFSVTYLGAGAEAQERF